MIKNPSSKAMDDFKIIAKTLYPELASSNINLSDGRNEISDPWGILRSQPLYIRESKEPPGPYNHL